jgi:hypothetical protein
MRTRAARTIAWSALAMTAGALAYGFALPPHDDTSFACIIALPLLVVGALVALRRPDNPVGWLCLAFAAAAVIAFTSGRYWTSGPDGANSRPYAVLAASLSVHLWH